jgi:hypothetical protein
MVKTYYGSLGRILKLIKDNHLRGRVNENEVLKNLEVNEDRISIKILEPRLKKIQYEIDSLNHYKIKGFQRELTYIFNSVIESDFKNIYIKYLSKGVNGKVFLSKYDGVKPFVIKENIDVKSSLEHEALIGFLMNALRPVIPNYMYTYCYFECGEDNGKNICSKFTSRDYIAVENIHNNKTLYNSIIDKNFTSYKNSVGDVLDIILQILSSLSVAQKYYKFMHNDLHNNNVLLQENIAGIYIPIYKDGKLIMNFKPRYIARIIDFGMSNITLSNGVKFQYKDKEFNGLFDIYKIIMFCFEDFYNYNPEREIIKKFEMMYSYFHNDKERGSYVTIFEESEVKQNFYVYERNGKLLDFYNFFLKKIYV